MHIYRNDALIQVESHKVAPAQAHELVDKIRAKWAYLRDNGWAGDYPIEVLRNQGDEMVTVVEVFRWNSKQDQLTAEANPQYVEIQQQVTSATHESSAGRFTEAVRGFNTNFPIVGGVELLKGVCSCLLTIDGMVENFPMSVKNGVVLMHRSPRFDQDRDGRNEMYLKILMHGGELIQGALGPIRVEQNFNLPNDGIVKSNGIGTRDFPATAVWRVHWRIQTPLGPIMTDPQKPLIFGPTVVQHYPPVGTRFHSATGPVALLMESNGQRVGTLTPGELTAFDIVVTKDDEIYADHLNLAPSDLYELLKTPQEIPNDIAKRAGDSHTSLTA